MSKIIDNNAPASKKHRHGVHTKFCQSCSMPLSDELLGTESDGTKNKDYCQFCYMNGKFTHPHHSLEDMITHLQDQMDDENMPEDIIEAAISRLPTLKRWKKNMSSKILKT